MRIRLLRFYQQRWYPGAAKVAEEALTVAEKKFAFNLPYMASFLDNLAELCRTQACIPRPSFFSNPHWQAENIKKKEDFRKLSRGCDKMDDKNSNMDLGVLTSEENDFLRKIRRQ